MIRISITDFYKYRVYHKYVHESQSVGQIEILQNEASLIWKHMLKVNNKVIEKRTWISKFLQTQINSDVLVKQLRKTLMIIGSPLCLFWILVTFTRLMHLFFEAMKRSRVTWFAWILLIVPSKYIPPSDHVTRKFCKRNSKFKIGGEFKYLERAWELRSFCLCSLQLLYYIMFYVKVQNNKSWNIRA